MSKPITLRSYPSHAEEDAPAKLFQLITSRQWMELSKYLSTKQGQQETLDLYPRRNHKESFDLTTPLHLCCTHHATLSVVKQLVRLDPAALVQCDNSGHMPLHVAVKEGAPLHVIRFLVAELPEVASLADLEGRTVLILACQRMSKDMDTATQLISGAGKDDAKAKGILEALCAAAPLSINVEDLSGTSALSYAVLGGVSDRVKTMLLKCSADAGEAIAKWDGQVPPLSKQARHFETSVAQSSRRHLSSCHKKAPPLASFIAHSQWTQLEEQLSGEEGRAQALGFRTVFNPADKSTTITTALHLACFKRPPLSVVKQLVQVCPFALPQLDSAGRMPLHVALRHGAALDVIDYLMTQFPPAATMVDWRGRTPLMNYCSNINRKLLSSKSLGKVRDIMKKLCAASPSLVNAQEAGGEGQTALEIAMRSEAPEYVIDCLMEQVLIAKDLKKGSNRLG